MPGGDRSGPWGRGPRTGRGFGYCSGSERPGYAPPRGPVGGYRYGDGYGRGYGRGWGFGRGWGRGWGGGGRWRWWHRFNARRAGGRR